MKIIASILMACVLFFSTQVTAAEMEEAISEATAEANVQLMRIDTGDYDLTKGYAGLFIRMLDQNQWTMMLKGVREPLGGVVIRELSESSFHTALPGLPDGEYVVIRFKTQFENKAEATEIITMLRDAATSQWRVGGYIIQ